MLMDLLLTFTLHCICILYITNSQWGSAFSSLTYLRSLVKQITNISLRYSKHKHVCKSSNRNLECLNEFVYSKHKLPLSWYVYFSSIFMKSLYILCNFRSEITLIYLRFSHSLIWVRLDLRNSTNEIERVENCTYRKLTGCELYVQMSLSSCRF